MFLADRVTARTATCSLNIPSLTRTTKTPNWWMVSRWATTGETDTPVLILNACRSAHAEFQAQPDVAKDVDESQSQVRAFGSLAQEVMNEGVAGVVAMRYNVYVVTAAQFVADLYAALASGQGLGEAVSMGRKQLAAQPLREIAFDPIPLQDWSVPVAYEAAPIQLFARAESAPPIKIDLSKNTRAEDNLPRPDVGLIPGAMKPSSRLTVRSIRNLLFC
jgi:hypothetical protein